MAGKFLNVHNVTTVIYLALILTTSNYKWTRLPVHWEAPQHHGTFSFDGQPEKEIECVDLINFTEKNQPQCTLLQKLSKSEVKAARCGNFTICLPLRFYVKSNSGEFKQSKNVIFGTFRGSEF